MIPRSRILVSFQSPPGPFLKKRNKVISMSIRLNLRLRLKMRRFRLFLFGARSASAG